MSTAITERADPRRDDRLPQRLRATVGRLGARGAADNAHAVVEAKRRGELEVESALGRLWADRPSTPVSTSKPELARAGH